ncbi:hypothetical protein ElyMa_006517600 [Elysia marginata]|uniref:DDE Tnp4 domain-containing protein n=1 Tax=Elysia marginata TaxID=1093978 RepID=A0AAV4I9L0_9GAST|nr:hypothetical protein ElyMa_006517600 [Elysia marginata]
MWRILLRQIDEQPDDATNVIKTITVLHNFILIQETERSVVQHTENDMAEPRVLTYDKMELSRSRATKCCFQLKDKFKAYFLSPQGALRHVRAHSARALSLSRVA